MTNANEMITAVEEQIFEAVRQGQDAIVKAVQTWADAGKNLIPDLPALPFADQLPNTVDLVESAFGFADRLLESQRSFATAVLAAAKPVLAKEGAATNGAATKPTPAKASA